MNSPLSPACLHVSDVEPSVFGPFYPLQAHEAGLLFKSNQFKPSYKSLKDTNMVDLDSLQTYAGGASNRLQIMSLYVT